jgi:hypothetical protein
MRRWRNRKTLPIWNQVVAPLARTSPVRVRTPPAALIYILASFGCFSISRFPPAPFSALSVR